MNEDSITESIAMSMTFAKPLRAIAGPACCLAGRPRSGSQQAACLKRGNDHYRTVSSVRLPLFQVVLPEPSLRLYAGLFPRDGQL